MSGGSYNYLYNIDAEDLVNRTHDLEAMATKLDSLGYAAIVAADTRELIEKAEEYHKDLSARLQKLSDVWRAVEYWESCDCSEDEAAKAVANYKE